MHPLSTHTRRIQQFLLILPLLIHAYKFLAWQGGLFFVPESESEKILADPFPTKIPNTQAGCKLEQSYQGIVANITPNLSPQWKRKNNNKQTNYWYAWKFSAITTSRKKRVQWWKIMRCNFYCLIVWAMLLVVGWCCCGCFALCRLCFLDIFGLMLITRTAFALKKPKAIKIFMTHWVITSNPQTWVMATPPNSLTSPPRKGREKLAQKNAKEKENERPRNGDEEKMRSNKKETKRIWVREQEEILKRFIVLWFSQGSRPAAAKLQLFRFRFSTWAAGGQRLIAMASRSVLPEKPMPLALSLPQTAKWNAVIKL